MFANNYLSSINYSISYCKNKTGPFLCLTRYDRWCLWLVICHWRHW